MTVRLSDLIDPEQEARLRAIAGNEQPTNDAATGELESKSVGSAVDLERKADPGLGGAQVLSADDETGVVEALVSVTGVEDRVKDIIEPGAYTKTLGRHEPIGVWSHDDKTWVARTEEAVELMPGDPFFKGLTTMDGQPWPAAAGAVKVKARFNLETTHGREAYSDVKFFQGKTGWSIGYRATKAHRNPRTGVRHIKELDWFEYSPVMVGAASQPMTLSVKSLAQPVDADAPADLVDVDALEPAELARFAELKAEFGLETKDRVRTAAGQRRYGQPIGSVIVPDDIAGTSGPISNDQLQKMAERARANGDRNEVAQLLAAAKLDPADRREALTTGKLAKVGEAADGGGSESSAPKLADKAPGAEELRGMSVAQLALEAAQDPRYKRTGTAGQDKEIADLVRAGKFAEAEKAVDDLIDDLSSNGDPTGNLGAISDELNRRAKERSSGEGQAAAAPAASRSASRDEAGGGTPAENAQNVIDAIQKEGGDTDELQTLFDRWQKSGDKGDAAALADALEDVEGPSNLDAVITQLRKVRASRAQALRNADRRGDATADARIAERAKLAAYNKRRRARGQLPVLKLPENMKGLPFDLLDTLPDEAVEEVKGSRASLDRSPKRNWVENAGELPGYVREVARAIEREQGVDLDRAIPIAIGRIKRWARGEGGVKPDTVAKAQAAVAEWEALKAKAGKKFDSELLEDIEHKTLAAMDAADEALAVLYDTGQLDVLLGVKADDLLSELDADADDLAAEVKDDDEVEAPEPVVEVKEADVVEAVEPPAVEVKSLTAEELARFAELRARFA